MGFVLFGGNFGGALLGPRCRTLVDRGRLVIMNAKEQEKLLQALEARFEKNMHRHSGIAWAKVRAKLEGNPDALTSLREMEATGGEPDVIGQDNGQFIYCDCSPESPTGRRSACYDGEALESRKENKPANSAVEMAAAMGIDLLTEEQYRAVAEARRLRHQDV